MKTPSRCNHCGSHDFYLQKHLTFSYWFCNGCKNEVDPDGVYLPPLPTDFIGVDPAFIHKDDFLNTPIPAEASDFDKAVIRHLYPNHNELHIVAVFAKYSADFTSDNFKVITSKIAKELDSLKIPCSSSSGHFLNNNMQFLENTCLNHQMFNIFKTTHKHDNHKASNNYAFNFTSKVTISSMGMREVDIKLIVTIP